MSSPITFLLTKCKMKENRDALNPNFKLFSLKDMMYLSRWYCIYRPSISWNCLQIVTLVLFYETMRRVPKNILNLSIYSSFNWGTLTSVQRSTMAYGYYFSSKINVNFQLHCIIIYESWFKYKMYYIYIICQSYQFYYQNKNVT